jgi:hypothetical protein
MNYETFVKSLTAAIPEYRPENGDLPHVALGGLVSFLREQRSRHDARYPTLLTAAARFVEEASGSSDERVGDLLKVSFIENLHLLDGDCRLLVGKFGPTARRLLADYEAEWGSVCG